MEPPRPRAASNAQHRRSACSLGNPEGQSRGRSNAPPPARGADSEQEAGGTSLGQSQLLTNAVLERWSVTAATAWVLLGLLQGMRHALEPDHLVAVSTFAGEAPGPRGGLLLGAWWGLGHALALLLVGGMLALFRTTLPEQLATGFELLVSLMLLGLGARALLRARALMQEAGGELQAHWHFGRAHAHPGDSRHIHLGDRAFALRPLGVGIIHGLAGSGALTVWLLAGFPTHAQRLAYTLVFGGGAVLGMAVLSGVAGWPLATLLGSSRGRGWTSAVSGALSVLLGLLWGWPLVGKLAG
jgi:hypothetical protein